MISGIYENCVATIDLAAALTYWAEFGFQPVGEGTLSDDAAEALYGHRSALKSVRLRNGPVDTHGHLRLFSWDTLRDSGLGLAPPLTVGGRWFIQNCADIWLVKDTFDDLARWGDDYIVTMPSRAQMKLVAGDRPTIANRRHAVRELMILGEETRQAFFQRYNYVRATYGRINPDAPLGTSEFTHSSFIIADDSKGSFYTETLGMLVTNELHPSSGAKPGNQDTLRIDNDQTFTIQGYMSPGAECGMFQFYCPGWETPNLLDRSRPGSRGLSLSTWRVDDVAAYHRKVRSSAATDVTDILPNEFGEQSFSFVAPDGVFWTILG